MSLKLVSTFLQSCSTGTISFTLFASTLVLWYLYIRISKRRFYYLLSKIDGIRGLPILGNALDFIHDPHTAFEIVWRKCIELEFKKPFKLWIGPQPLVFLNDPRDIEVILGSHVHLHKSWHYNTLKPWIGDGLLINVGDKWRRHRKLIAPTFQQAVVKKFVGIFNENSRALVGKLKKLENKEFDVHNYLARGAVETLLESAMGVNKKTQSKEVNDYASAMMKMYNIVHLRHTHILYLFDIVFRFTTHAKIQEKLIKIVHNFSDKTINTKKSNMQDGSEFTEENLDNQQREIDKSEKSYNYAAGWKDDIDADDDIGDKKRMPFLDQLITNTGKGSILTDQEIREEVDTIMFEGHDTIAATGSFFLCVMGAYPDIQEKVVDELNSIFKGSDRLCTFYDTLEMKYLERCIMETLRRFPPVPVITRQIKEEIELPSTKAILPAECDVVIPIYRLHQDLDTFSNPEEFNPDNFLPENVTGRHFYSYVPFSAGPRSCVGRKYAMLMMKILLSTVLRNFRIRSSTKPSEWPLQVDLILKRSDGFRISLESRV